MGALMTCTNCHSYSVLILLVYSVTYTYIFTFVIGGENCLQPFSEKVVCYAEQELALDAPPFFTQEFGTACYDLVKYAFDVSVTDELEVELCTEIYKYLVYCLT